MTTKRTKPSAADQVLADRAIKLAKSAGKKMTVHAREVAAVRRALPRNGVSQEADALVAIATDRSRKIKEDPAAKQVATLSEKIGNRFGPRVVAIIMAAVKQGIPEVAEEPKAASNGKPKAAAKSNGKGKAKGKAKAAPKGKATKAAKSGAKRTPKAPPQPDPAPAPEPDETQAGTPEPEETPALGIAGQE